MKRIDLKYHPGTAGRLDFQAGWHHYYQNEIIFNKSCTTLDIGSGLGKIKDRVKIVDTSDIYPGCENYVDKPYTDIYRIPYKKRYDYVTMFDVIEHLRNDVGALEAAMDIARLGVFITTPNFDTSKCHNKYHVREYIPEQFVILCSQVSDYVTYYSGDAEGRNHIIRYASSSDFTNHRNAHQGALLKCQN